MKLTNSQRVRVIQDVAVHLGPEDWTIVDLILSQFGLPTTNEWQGTKSDYVINMVRDAPDVKLVEIGQHFGMKFEGNILPAGPDNEPEYWHAGHLRVFISHLSAHKQQAADLQTAMQKRGMSGFVAHNDINPTAEWQIEIEKALATCHLLVALIHPDFSASKWCDQEVGYALGRGIPVFAVRCGGDPQGFVSRFQAFNGHTKSPFQLATELFEAAVEHKKLQDKMADVVIDQFVNSGTYAAAKERVGYVERLKVWDPSYNARIAKALKQNDQIYGSWGVPEQVNGLLLKWK